MKQIATMSRTLPRLSCLLLLAAVILLNATGCATKIQAADLMKGIQKTTVSGEEADATFTENIADFSVNLFQKTLTEGENSLISPLSVLLALAMTANGADQETRVQMEALLGGGIPLDTLNEYLYSYVNSLPSEETSKLSIANSIWFRDDADKISVKKDFLQKNADYYSAAVYQSAFDGQTIRDINNWVKQHTNGMIDKIVDKIDQDTVMYLINALVFDAEWAAIYETNQIFDGVFAAASGQEQTVKMMASDESLYIKDSKATGFIKPYKNNHYSFVAILPNEGIGMDDYLASLTGESFRNIIKNAELAHVSASLPKFQYEYEVTMNKALAELGMSDAFDSAVADFSKLGHSSLGNIYIGEVLHKTYLSVDERGTKAGAVTKVEMKAESAVPGYSVRLDRPFVYAIVDNQTNLPLFLGTVMSIEQ